MPVFNHTAHKALWNWIADNTKEGSWPNKLSWPGWEGNGGKYARNKNTCFACEYTLSLEGKPYCPRCPLVWPDLDGCLTTQGIGLYDLWECADSTEIRQYISLRIANLPVKDGVECI